MNGSKGNEATSKEKFETRNLDNIQDTVSNRTEIQSYALPLIRVLFTFSFLIYEGHFVYRINANSSVQTDFCADIRASAIQEISFRR